MSTPRPFPQSYWVREGLLCAGAYPGSPEPSAHAEKCRGVVAAGVRRVISLMEDCEVNHDGLPFTPYAPVMQQFATERAATIEFMALPIRDAAIERVLELRRPLPKHHYPFETDQEAFVRTWVPK